MRARPDSQRLPRGVYALAIAGLLLPIYLYLGSALIVFDFTKAAYDPWQEHREGHPVAIGPRPIRSVCSPTQADYYYYGTEWPFVVYAPVCAVWRFVTGHVKPLPWPQGFEIGNSGGGVGGGNGRPNGGQVGPKNGSRPGAEK